MKFEPATGLSEGDLEALALKLLGTQHNVEDHNDAGVNNSDLEDDLYEGGFAATCVYCGFWVRPDLLDCNDICEDCVHQMEEDEMDDMDDSDIIDDDPADVDNPDYHLSRTPDWLEDWDLEDPDFDEDDEVVEEEWDDLDTDGIDDFDWEEED